MAQYLEGAVAPLLADGCRRLKLQPSAAAELLRFLKLKSWYDALPASRRSCGMSPGAAVDRLWHYMLLNTRVSSAVHAALGGVVEHVGTDEEDLSDNTKMLQRLLSMNMLAVEGWAPTLQLWQDPGTLMHEVSVATDAAALLKYTCPTMTAAQQQQLEAHLQAVYAGRPRSNGFAAEESTFLLNRMLNSWEQPPQPQPQPQPQLQPQTQTQPPQLQLQPPTPPPQQVQPQQHLQQHQQPAPQAQPQESDAPTQSAQQQPISLTVLLPGEHDVVLSSLTVTTPADATVGSVKQCLSAVADAQWQQRSVLFCAGVGVLSDDAASVSQLGICDGFVLRWCSQEPSLSDQPVAVKVAESWSSCTEVDGRLAPWMWLREVGQVLQLATAIPVACQDTQLCTPTGQWAPHQSCGTSSEPSEDLTVPEDQQRLDELELGWPEQALTINLGHTDAISLTVKLPQQLGGTFADLQVLPSHTVQQVQQLALRKAAEGSLQQLGDQQPRLFAIHVPHDLQPQATLEELRIGPSSLLRLLLPGAPRPQLTTGEGARHIFVKTLTGRTTTFSVCLTDTYVSELKQLVMVKMGLARAAGATAVDYGADAPLGCQRLIFAGKQLENLKTLSECGVSKEKTLTLVVRGC